MLLVLAIPVTFNAGAQRIPGDMAAISRALCLAVSLGALLVVSVVTYLSDPFPKLQRWKTGVSLLIYGLSASVSVVSFLSALNDATAAGGGDVSRGVHAVEVMATGIVIVIVLLAFLLPLLLLWDLRNSIIHEGLEQWARWRAARKNTGGSKGGEGGHMRPWSEPYSTDAVCYVSLVPRAAPLDVGARAAEEEEEAARVEQREGGEAAAAERARLAALCEEERVEALLAKERERVYAQRCRLKACALWRGSIHADLWQDMRCAWTRENEGVLNTAGWTLEAIETFWQGIVLGHYDELGEGERGHFEERAREALGEGARGNSAGITAEEREEACGRHIEIDAGGEGGQGEGEGGAFAEEGGEADAPATSPRAAHSASGGGGGSGAVLPGGTQRENPRLLVDYDSDEELQRLQVERHAQLEHRRAQVHLDEHFERRKAQLRAQELKFSQATWQNFFLPPMLPSSLDMPPPTQPQARVVWRGGSGDTEVQNPLRHSRF